MTSNARDDQSPPASIILTAVTALSLAAFASGVSQRLTDALLPRLSTEFDLPLGTVSWAITCFTIGYAACQLFFGPIGDRYGKYSVIAWSCVACSLAALLCGLSGNLPMLLVARALAGGTTAAIIPLAMAWIGDVVPYERRQPVLARFLIGQILGASAGQLLGGFSADHLGRRVPFFIVAALFAVGTTALFVMRRRLPAQALQVQPADGHMLSHLWRAFAEVFAIRWARAVLTTVFLEGALVFGAFAFLATHLHQALNISLTASGTILMLFGFGGLLFATAARGLVTRLGELGLARGGGAVMLVSLSVIAWAPNVWLSALFCFVLGLGFYMLHNTLQTNATQMAPERRGAAVSAFAFSYFLGQSAGVAVAGWSVAHIGLRNVIFVAALGVLFTALNFMREKRQHIRHTQIA
jgi:predicted MFS family arabinose efflux permease